MKKTLTLFIALIVPALTFAQQIDVSGLTGEEWYGLYMNGSKVGYSRTELSVLDDGFVSLVEDAKFKLVMSGRKQDMGVYSKRVYRPDGSLFRIDSRVDDSSGTNEFVAIVEGDELVLKTVVGGYRRTTRGPKPRESLQDALSVNTLVGDGAEIGDTVTWSLYEPTLQSELTGSSTIVGVEERVFDGVATQVFKIRTFIEELAIESISYVTADGTTLEDRIAGGVLTMRLEPEHVAKDVSYSNDVIVSNAARVSKPIRNPRRRERLALRLTGPLDELNLINEERQTLSASGDHFVFEGRKISLEGFDTAATPVEEASVRRWLEPSLFVQSDSPRLIEKAREIVAGETDTFKIVELLTDWVYTNVRTTFSAKLTNSLEVLDNLEGDCTEHSMLFIGLARAAGVPAREAAGLIYVDSPAPGFYFHQWATVWVGKWVDVDPTFGQSIADATHIKLAEGDLLEQTKLLPVIGQLQVEVADPQ